MTRFAVTKPAAQALPPETKNPELAWQREAALDFLDSFVGGPEDQDLTMLTLTAEFKKKLPSPSIADAGLGYAKKDVRKWLNDQRAGATGYTLREQKERPGGSEITGELLGAAQPKKFTIVIAVRDHVAQVDNVAFE